MFLIGILHSLVSVRSLYSGLVSKPQTFPNFEDISRVTSMRPSLLTSDDRGLQMILHYPEFSERPRRNSNHAQGRLGGVLIIPILNKRSSVTW